MKALVLIVIFLVVECDQESIPTIEHAEHNISSQLPVNNGYFLPGSASVIYTCKDGYAMSGTQSTAQCVYHKQKRKNDPDNKLVTAIWDGHRNISCGKGIGKASIKAKA